MDPVSNQKYSDDFEKFVLQNQNVNKINYESSPIKPFSIEPTKKKDKDKEKNKKNEKGKKDKPFWMP